MGLDRDKWLEQLKQFFNKYDNTVHSTIEMTPNDAKKCGNRYFVSFNLWKNANK